MFCKLLNNILPETEMRSVNSFFFKVQDPMQKILEKYNIIEKCSSLLCGALMIEKGSNLCHPAFSPTLMDFANLVFLFNIYEKNGEDFFSLCFLAG